jgi:hypothetical protein
VCLGSVKPSFAAALFMSSSVVEAMGTARSALWFTICMSYKQDRQASEACRADWRGMVLAAGHGGDYFGMVIVKL